MQVIDKKKVLAVEGKDEEYFFMAFLQHMGIPASEFSIYDIGGKDQFKDKIPALVQASGFFDVVEVFVIVRDAEDNADSAFKSISNILRKQNLVPPRIQNQFSEGNPKVGVFIMPGDSKEGMLEDLCLKTVENHPAMECVNAFVGCVSQLKFPPKNISKAKAQTFLSAMPDIVNCVGQGAQKCYWDFNSTALADLKSFLANLMPT